MAFWGNNDDKKKDAFSRSTASSPSGESPKSFLSSPGGSTATSSSGSSSGFAAGLSTNEDLKVRSALGPGTVIQGKLSFDAPVSIDGKLSGEIYSSKTLIVGKSGSVDAQVDVAVLIVKGIVKGQIKASERIEIRESGQLLGDVVTPSLVIEEGCVFNGGCSMSSSSSLKKAS